MAVNVTPGFDLQPSAQQVPLESNYITDFNFLNQYLPDTYEKEFERNNLLEETDIYMVLDYPITETKRTEFQTYRTSLRNIPTTYSETQPRDITFESGEEDELGFSLGGIQIVQNMTDEGNGIYSGPYAFSFKNMRIAPPHENEYMFAEEFKLDGNLDQVVAALNTSSRNGENAGTVFVAYAY